MEAVALGTLSKTMANLQNLPHDLIRNVLDFTPLASHLDFALTCCHIAKCAEPTLQRHRECLEACHAACDRLPRTIPLLLRAAFQDPIVAWHVRTLEFWTGRLKWAHWEDVTKADELVEALTTAQRGLQEIESPIQHPVFSQTELDTFVEYMEQSLYFEAEEASTWRDRIEEGCDGALKGLLVAICPRLQKLRFVACNQREAEVDDSDEDDISLASVHDRCLEFLGIAVKSNVKTENESGGTTEDEKAESSEKPSPWAPGLESLRDLAIGVGVSGRDSTYFNDPCLIFPLMRFPNLVNLHISRLSDSHSSIEVPADFNEEEMFWDSFLPDLSVHCDSLTIEEADVVSLNVMHTIAASIWGLETLVIQGSNIDDDNDPIRELVNYANPTKNMLVYGSREVPDYNPAISFPSEAYYLEGISNAVTISTWDLEMDCGYVSVSEDERDFNDDRDANDERDPNQDRYNKYIFKFMPSGVRALIFKPVPSGIPPLTSKTGGYSGDYLDEALAAMIADECYRGELQAIYLEPLERVHPTDPLLDDTQGKREFWFQKTVAAGLKHNVDVHTYWNQTGHKHQIELPTAIALQDLETLPAEQSDGNPASREGQVFDVMTGVWKDAGCRGCGKCKVCFKVYPKSCWERGGLAIKESKDKQTRGPEVE